MDDFNCEVQCEEIQAYYDWAAMQQLEYTLETMTEEDWAEVFNNEDYPEDYLEDMPF